MALQDRNTLKRISKLTALALRHQPEVLGLTLDEHGWADISELIRGICQRYPSFDRETLDLIVETDDKKRYSYDESENRIRANQGHSIEVDVELKESVPPAVLYHGTAEKSVASIEEEGLKPMSRLYVHLSSDPETALKVGSRHGKPLVFLVDAEKMRTDGYTFFLSENGVWLTKAVPKEYIKPYRH